LTAIADQRLSSNRVVKVRVPPRTLKQLFQSCRRRRLCRLFCLVGKKATGLFSKDRGVLVAFEQRGTQLEHRLAVARVLPAEGIPGRWVDGKPGGAPLA
jgi:hypothetical protein